MSAPEAATSPSTRAQGVLDTRRALERWDADPGRVLGPWFAWGLVLALALLASVWLVSLFANPDPVGAFIPGEPNPAEIARILTNNLLVLALHATACVAGFIAGSSLRHDVARRTGLSRLVHEKAGQVAIAWVVLATAFSLVTQALTLGAQGATLADELGISSLTLIATALPHALLELTAIFLPLAAFLIASRRDQWSDLLAATLVTVSLALPMLVAAAVIEVYVWPELLISVSPFLP